MSSSVRAWGQTSQTGAMALMAALLSILVYVGFRFESRLAAGLLLRWRTTLSYAGYFVVIPYRD
ncbi:hypothetical protein ACNKHM_05125 [Shigella sonnei]